MILFAYLGPDSMIPLASALAAVVGFLLLFGRQAIRLVLKLLGRGRRDEPEELPGPEDDVKD